MDAAQNAFNSVSDTVKGATDTASKETNKNVAKDSDASAGTRAEAAKDAVGDKANEVKHSIYTLRPQSEVDVCWFEDNTICWLTSPFCGK
ncbi:Glucose-repressible protein [Imshaugia aleurites]|uniref:Glucose-repressible protein n=1 Tax=Imshaugia aleurites TaxID=172621 RepID=A0A8H3PD97_9LECA|nr:Glucose-repressible protein [Imshaugia aleurites]